MPAQCGTRVLRTMMQMKFCSNCKQTRLHNSMNPKKPEAWRCTNCGVPVNNQPNSGRREAALQLAAKKQVYS